MRIAFAWCLFVMFATIVPAVEVDIEVRSYRDDPGTPWAFKVRQDSVGNLSGSFMWTVGGDSRLNYTYSQVELHGDKCEALAEVVSQWQSVELPEAADKPSLFYVIASDEKVDLQTQPTNGALRRWVERTARKLAECAVDDAPSHR